MVSKTVPKTDEVMRADEAMEFIKMSRSAFWRAVYSDQIRSVRYGTARRFEKSELRRYVESCREYDGGDSANTD